MTQEDKELLLKDLCARLPYGVKFNFNGNVYTLSGIDECVDDEWNWVKCLCSKGISPIDIEYCKPYLFPMSSIIKRDLQDFDKHFIAVSGRDIICSTDGYDWLNKNHFDYRGLIEKSLALDATGLNIY